MKSKELILLTEKIVKSDIKVNALNYIDCKECKKQFLVGLNGIDIRGHLDSSNPDGDKDKNVPETYFAIGNDQLAKCPRLPNYADCPNCKKRCKVMLSG